MSDVEKLIAEARRVSPMVGQSREQARGTIGILRGQIDVLIGLADMVPALADALAACRNEALELVEAAIRKEPTFPADADGGVYLDFGNTINAICRLKSPPPADSKESEDAKQQ